MDINNKEEMIEELDDIETSTPLQNDEIIPDKKIEDEIKVDIIQDAILTTPENSSVIKENNGEKIEADEKSILIDNKETEEKVESKEEQEKQQSVEKSKKSKTPLLILLFVLLIIDVAALVIYIIGIDKVLGFIK